MPPDKPLTRVALKKYGNSNCVHKLRDLEQSLLNRPSILPFVNLYERGMKM